MTELQMFPRLHHDPKYPILHFRVIDLDQPVRIVDEKDIDLEQEVV